MVGRIGSVMVAIGVAMPLLVACGGDDETTSTDEPTAASESPSADVPAAGGAPGTVEVSFNGSTETLEGYCEIQTGDGAPTFVAADGGNDEYTVLIDVFGGEGSIAVFDRDDSSVALVAGDVTSFDLQLDDGTGSYSIEAAATVDGSPITAEGSCSNVLG